MMNRRSFVYSLPLVAAPALGAQSPRSRQNRANDPVLAEVQRQLVSAFTVFETNAADAAKQHATALRVLVAYAPTTDLPRTLQNAAKRHNGERPNWNAARQELRRLGLRVDPGDLRFQEPPLDLTLQQRAAGLLQADGPVPYWTQAADYLDGLAPRLPVLRPVTVTQETCYGQWVMEYIMEVQMVLSCSAGLLLGPEICVIMTVNYFLWRGYMVWSGC